MTLLIIILIAVILVIGNELLKRFQISNFFRQNQKSDAKFHNSKLVMILLGLDDHAFVELLALYEKEFGKGPARYAKRTYQKWKSGSVQPAWQTYERFLIHLPKVMTYDLKCEVLRHFMEEYAEKDKYEMEVHTSDWEEKLTPLVKQIVDKAFTAQLPIEIERKLKWLGDGDMQAAQAILRSSQAEEGKIAISMLRGEFAGIEKLLEAEGLNPKISHTLKFPYGTIELKIKRN